MAAKALPPVLQQGNPFAVLLAFLFKAARFEVVTAPTFAPTTLYVKKVVGGEIGVNMSLLDIYTLVILSF